MGFKNIFKRKSNKKTAPTTTKVPLEMSHSSIMKMKNNLYLQEKREEYLQLKMVQMEMEAKRKLSKGDKKGALFAMKRRKLHSIELSKIENIKMTLETQIITLEGATQNIHTVNVMSQGNTALSKNHKLFGLEQVNNLMDDIRETAENHRDIEDALTQPIDHYTACDDDDLMAELMELETTTEATKASVSLWPTTTPYKKVTPSPKQQQHIIAVQPQQQHPTSTKKFALFAS